MKRYPAIAAVCLTVVFGTTASAQQVPEPDVRGFVHGNSFTDSYAELAALYDSAVVPNLIEMLGSKSEESYWPRVAYLLGVVGDERAVDALIAFMQEPVTDVFLSRAQHDARKAAIMSLGYLIDSTGSERALGYLIDGLTPAVWRQRNVQGVASWMTSYEEYDRRLSEYSLFGLALSGHAEAGEALRSLQQSPTPEQAQLRNGLDSTLEQWLEVHTLVAERGVAGMYEHYEAQQRLEAERRLEEVERLHGPEAQRRLEAR